MKLSYTSFRGCTSILIVSYSISLSISLFSIIFFSISMIVDFITSTGCTNFSTTVQSGVSILENSSAIPGSGSTTTHSRISAIDLSISCNGTAKHSVIQLVDSSGIGSTSGDITRSSSIEILLWSVIKGSAKAVSKDTSSTGRSIADSISIWSSINAIELQSSSRGSINGFRVVSILSSLSNDFSLADSIVVCSRITEAAAFFSSSNGCAIVFNKDRSSFSDNANVTSFASIDFRSSTTIAKHSFNSLRGLAKPFNACVSSSEIDRAISEGDSTVPWSTTIGSVTWMFNSSTTSAQVFKDDTSSDMVSAIGSMIICWWSTAATRSAKSWRDLANVSNTLSALDNSLAISGMDSVTCWTAATEVFKSTNVCAIVFNWEAFSTSDKFSTPSSIVICSWIVAIDFWNSSSIGFNVVFSNDTRSTFVISSIACSITCSPWMAATKNCSNCCSGGISSLSIVTDFFVSGVSNAFTSWSLISSIVEMDSCNNLAGTRMCAISVSSLIACCDSIFLKIVAITFGLETMAVHCFLNSSTDFPNACNADAFSTSRICWPGFSIVVNCWTIATDVLRSLNDLSKFFMAAKSSVSPVKLMVSLARINCFCISETCSFNSSNVDLTGNSCNAGIAWEISSIISYLVIVSFFMADKNDSSSLRSGSTMFNKITASCFVFFPNNSLSLSIFIIVFCNALIGSIMIFAKSSFTFFFIEASSTNFFTSCCFIAPNNFSPASSTDLAKASKREFSSPVFNSFISSCLAIVISWTLATHNFISSNVFSINAFVKPISLVVSEVEADSLVSCWMMVIDFCNSSRTGCKFNFSIATSFFFNFSAVSSPTNFPSSIAVNKACSKIYNGSIRIFNFISCSFGIFNSSSSFSSLICENDSRKMWTVLLIFWRMSTSTFTCCFLSSFKFVSVFCCLTIVEHCSSNCCIDLVKASNTDVFSIFISSVSSATTCWIALVDVFNSSIAVTIFSTASNLDISELAVNCSWTLTMLSFNSSKIGWRTIVRGISSFISSTVSSFCLLACWTTCVRDLSNFSRGCTNGVNVCTSILFVSSVPISSKLSSCIFIIVSRNARTGAIIVSRTRASSFSVSFSSLTVSFTSTCCWLATAKHSSNSCTDLAKCSKTATFSISDNFSSSLDSTVITLWMILREEFSSSNDFSVVCTKGADDCIVVACSFICSCTITTHFWSSSTTGDTFNFSVESVSSDISSVFSAFIETACWTVEDKQVSNFCNGSTKTFNISVLNILSSVILEESRASTCCSFSSSILLIVSFKTWRGLIAISNIAICDFSNCLGISCIFICCWDTTARHFWPISSIDFANDSKIDVLSIRSLACSVSRHIISRTDATEELKCSNGFSIASTTDISNLSLGSSLDGSKDTCSWITAIDFSNCSKTGSTFNFTKDSISFKSCPSSLIVLICSTVMDNDFSNSSNGSIRVCKTVAASFVSVKTRASTSCVCCSSSFETVSRKTWIGLAIVSKACWLNSSLATCGCCTELTWTFCSLETTEHTFAISSMHLANVFRAVVFSSFDNSLASSVSRVCMAATADFRFSNGLSINSATDASTFVADTSSFFGCCAVCSSITAIDFCSFSNTGLSFNSPAVFFTSSAVFISDALTSRTAVHRSSSNSSRGWIRGFKTSTISLFVSSRFWISSTFCSSISTAVSRNSWIGWTITSKTCSNSSFWIFSETFTFTVDWLTIAIHLSPNSFIDSTKDWIANAFSILDTVFTLSTSIMTFCTAPTENLRFSNDCCISFVICALPSEFFISSLSRIISSWIMTIDLFNSSRTLAIGIDCNDWTGCLISSVISSVANACCWTETFKDCSNFSRGWIILLKITAAVFFVGKSNVSVSSNVCSSIFAIISRRFCTGLTICSMRYVSNFISSSLINACCSINSTDSIEGETESIRETGFTCSWETMRTSMSSSRGFAVVSSILRFSSFDFITLISSTTFILFISAVFSITFTSSEIISFTLCAFVDKKKYSIGSCKVVCWREESSCWRDFNGSKSTCSDTITFSFNAGAKSFWVK